MKRAFIMVLDSFGIGATEDAERLVTSGLTPWVISQKLVPKAKLIMVVKARSICQSDPSGVGESTRRFYRFHSGGNGRQR